MPFKGLLKKLGKGTSSPPPDTKVSHRDHASRNAGSDYGLHSLNKPLSSSETKPIYLVDVVFIHGLNGHWARTWTHENTTFWPKDLLPDSLPGARIFSYGYPSKVFATKSVAGLRDFAIHLLDDLRLVQTEPYRPIIYVCHSLGGIVVKQVRILPEYIDSGAADTVQALITAHQRSEFKYIWSASKAIVFMGTPHRGSHYATYGKTLGDIANVASHMSFTHRFTGGIRTSLIETLTQENGELDGISEAFPSIVEGSALHIISVYETENHPLTSNPIVEKSSARLGVQGERFVPLYLNHQNLCRFSGLHDDNYSKVLDLIESEVSKEPGCEKTVSSSLCTDYSFDETEKACVSLLNNIDIAEYESKIDSRVEGTLEWVLQNPQYNDWASNPETRLLWVTGFAGCGKTVLASFISRNLNEQHSRALICRFYCDKKVQEYRDPCALLKSLIFQIANQRRRLWRLVKKASDAGGFHIFSQFNALWNLFVQLARTETKHPIMIIIDAFDEFEKGAQDRVAARILELLSLGNSTRVKLFVTSRPKAEVEFDFRTYSVQLSHLALEDSKGEIDSDIKSVIHHRLERMVTKGACMPPVRDTLERMLVAKADQTFLWITLVLPLIEERRLILLADVEMIVTRLPMTLESLYRHLLVTIPEANQAIAARILRLLVICDKPLTGEEIGIMLTIMPNHRFASSLTKEKLPFGHESIQAVLGSLVRTHGSHVELVHQSLRDYLIELSSDPQDFLATRFGVDRTRDKITTFRACSMYLSLEEFQQDIYTTLDSADDDLTETPMSSRPPSLYGLDIFDMQIFKDDFLADESTWAAVNAKFRLFDYAALHWAADFSSCNETTTNEDNSIALSLCKTETAQFKNWFHYFWYNRVKYEPVPTVVDRFMVLSYFGHTSNLLYVLHETGSIDTESLSRALYWASRQGHSACVILLLQQPGCDPQSSATYGQPPLLAAAQYGHLDCVSILLKDDRVSINAQDDFGCTALSLAVSDNHTEIVTALLAHESVDVNLQDNKLNTPLHMAVDVASDSIAAQLLADKRTEVDRVNRHGRSILSWAAELGAEESASLIIRRSRVTIDQKDVAGRTPLSYASQYGHLPVVRKLIENGHADPLGKDGKIGKDGKLDKDGSGRNAHSWAAMHRSSDVLSYLIKKCPQGADVPDRDGWTPIAWTLDPPGYLENMILLLESGRVNANHKDGVHGRTILSWAASYGYFQMASKLAQVKDVELDARDVNGRTPLSEAAGSGKLKIVQLLIATGRVEVNSQDRQGQTPLSWAARGGHTEVVELLLKYPAITLDAQNDSGETALDMARKFERDDIVLTLESWSGLNASSPA